MTERFDSEDAAAEVHFSLLTLHEAAGTYEGVGRLPGFARPSIGSALSSLAEAPPEEATVGAKLDTLVALAKADFPGYDAANDAYLQLASSIGAPYELSADQVLDDAKAIGKADARISETETGRALPHHFTAFVGEDVCHVTEVSVGGITSVWVFSEFETDAPFERVAEWVQPQSWPVRGSAMFKGMHVVGDGVNNIRPTSFTNHWHGEFLEDVQLFERLKTLLHCDYFDEAGERAGMTYALTFSTDDKLTVDRGFLLAENLAGANPPVVRVKALKVVAFADELWNEVAKLVCPFWTDFVRQAAEGGGATTPRAPGGGGVPGAGGEDESMIGELCGAWIDFMGDAAKEYSQIAGTVVTKVLDGNYKVRDAMDDGTSYWTQLAKDWARAWSYGADMIEAVEEKGFVAPRPPGRETPAGERFVPIEDELRGVRSAAAAGRAPAAGVAAAAGGPAPAVETETVPVAGDVVAADVSCSELVGIEKGGPAIPASAITTAITDLGGGAQGVRISVPGAAFPPGMYTGTLELGGGRTTAVALYISHARLPG